MQVDADMPLLLANTVGLAVRFGVVLCIVHFLYGLRRSNHVPKALWILTLLLLCFVMLQTGRLVNEWAGTDRPSFYHQLTVSVGLAAFVWTPIVIFDVTVVRRSVRNAIVTNALCAPLLLGFLLFFRFVGLAILEGTASLVLSIGLIYAGAASTKEPLFRRQGLHLYAILSAAGLSAITLSFIVRSMTDRPLLYSLGASVTLQGAEALLLAGTLFAFVHLRNADRLLLRVMTVYLWTGGASAAWFLQRWMNGFQARSGGRPLVFTALLSFVLVGCVGLGSSVLSSKLPQLLERVVFGKRDWPKMQSAFSAGLMALQNEGEVLSYATTMIKLHLEAGTVWAKAPAELPLAAEQPREARVLRRQTEGTSGATPDSGTEVSVPIVLGEVVTWELRLQTGSDRPPLLASEERHLRDVVRLLETKLVALRLQQERKFLSEKEASFRMNLSEAERRALRAQVDPHFLFNTLNAIAELTATRPHDAEAMILRLAETFRYILTHGSEHTVTLRQELEFAEAYVAIQKERFGDHLHYEVNIPSALLDCAVPVLLLQPLLENAMKFGIARSTNGGKIHLSGSDRERGFELRLANFGDMEPAVRISDGRSTKIGLRNVRERLKLTFGPEAKLELVEWEARGAEVVAFIPYGVKAT